MAKELQSNKNRIVAVDILRLMAAIIVMYEHLYFVGTTQLTGIVMGFIQIAIARVSPIFFLLAGYFACRNISWKKALNNAWWSIAPYALWNVIALIILCYARPSLVEGRSTLSILGLTGFINGEHPINIPLWFMRDLFFLFLLSPILYKTAKYLFPVFILASALPATSDYLLFHSQTVLSLNSIAFFTAGCFLRTFSKETQQRCLSFYSPAIVIGYFALMVVLFFCTYFCHIFSSSEKIGFIQGLISLLVLYQAARWLEVKWPKARLFALKFAPVTFLTFAGHLIIYRLVPPFFHKTWCMLLLPIFCFGVASVLFFALKQWCRPLLHLVAHYKLRAEDVQKQP